MGAECSQGRGETDNVGDIPVNRPKSPFLQGDDDTLGTPRVISADAYVDDEPDELPQWTMYTPQRDIKTGVTIIPKTGDVVVTDPNTKQLIIKPTTDNKSNNNNNNDNNNNKKGKNKVDNDKDDKGGEPSENKNNNMNNTINNNNNKYLYSDTEVDSSEVDDYGHVLPGFKINKINRKITTKQLNKQINEDNKNNNNNNNNINKKGMADSINKFKTDVLDDDDYDDANDDNYGHTGDDTLNDLQLLQGGTTDNINTNNKNNNNNNISLPSSLQRTTQSTLFPGMNNTSINNPTLDITGLSISQLIHKHFNTEQERVKALIAADIAEKNADEAVPLLGSEPTTSVAVNKLYSSYESMRTIEANGRKKALLNPVNKKEKQNNGTVAAGFRTRDGNWLVKVSHYYQDTDLKHKQRGENREIKLEVARKRRNFVKSQENVRRVLLQLEVDEREGYTPPIKKSAAVLFS